MFENIEEARGFWRKLWEENIEEARGFWRKLWEERGTGNKNAAWLQEVKIAIHEQVPASTYIYRRGMGSRSSGSG